MLSINLADESLLQVYQNNQMQDRLKNNFLNYDDTKSKTFLKNYLQFDDTKFPILTFIAVLLVLTFFIYKFYKFKTRKRIKRSLYYSNDFQKLNKRSSFHRSISASNSTRNNFINSTKNVAKYNSRLNNFI